MHELLTPTTIVQVLILTLGIYLLLAFLRATRGSGLVHGLGLTLIVGVYGLWGAAGQLGLLELKHVIQGLLGFVFVILAIIFQPELRRGMASLGQTRLLGRLLKGHRKEVIAEVAAASVTMAKKKQGALIAFERKTPLDPYIEGAVKLDAEVNRYLLDSLFHHGNALHDGAVIIRGDRIVSAATLFPLTENFEISKSTGTRHRAALGLTEETDAVTVAVSEETGYISICKQGKMERRVPRAQLEELLRERVGGDEPQATPDEEEAEVERTPFLRRLLTEHLVQKLGAFVLACLVFYGARQDLIVPKYLELTLVAQRGGATGGAPQPNTLRVVLPGEEYRLGPESVGTCKVRFEGTREQLTVLQAGVAGVLNLGKDLPEGPIQLEVDLVDWGAVALEEGVRVSWQDEPPVVHLERLARRTVVLAPEMVPVLDDQLGARYEADREKVSFRPSQVLVRGPRAGMEELERRLETAAAPTDGEPAEHHLFDPVRPPTGGVGVRDLPVRLAADLAGLGLTIEGQLTVDVPVVPRPVDLGEIDVPIATPRLGLNGSSPRRFEPPAAVARFRILTRGLVSGDEESTEWYADRKAIRDFVKDRLRAFVDVDRIPPESRTGTVEHHGTENWRIDLPALDARFEAACKERETELEIELLSEETIQLEEVDAGDSGGENS